MQNPIMERIQRRNRVKTLQGTSYVIPEEQKELGSGAFGRVLKIYDISRRELDLAVKIISKKQIKDKTVVTKECQVIDKLPYCLNLVNYQKYCLESQNNYYLIMEYCNGGTLYDQLYISNKIYSEQEIIDFMIQFLNGYRSLLKSNILHRDIKPQNILIHNGIFKICDFGLSKIFERNDQNNSEDFLIRSCLPGTPLYLAPDFFMKQDYSINVDVFALGIILFQMLYSSPNRVMNLQQSGNQKKSVHPYFDLEGVISMDIYNQKMNNILKQQAHAYTYLDSYIEQCQVKRRAELKTLLKSMICINHQDRITFEELFNHPLFKLELDKIKNDEEYQCKVWNDLLQDKIGAIQVTEKENTPVRESEEYEETGVSVILNIDQIQKQLLHQKINICEQMSKIGSMKMQSNTYYQEKRVIYQNQLSYILKGKQQSNDKVISQYQQQSAITLGVKEQISSQQKQSEQILSEQIQQEQIQQEQKQSEQILSKVYNSIINNECDEESEESEIGDKNESGQKRRNDYKQMETFDNKQIENVQDEQLFYQNVEEYIRDSEIRLSNQQTIQKIEEVLQFFRQVYFTYKSIANQLSKAYALVKESSNRTRTDFIYLFNHVSLLSLILFKFQIQNLSKNFDKLLLDRNLFSNNENKITDHKILITDEEVILYKQSQEYALFVRQIDSDLAQLQSELDTYLSNQEFNQIYETYQKIVTSHSITKENYRKQISDLIKQGIEEFGFLEQKSFQQFQKTLLYLTEIDLYQKNNKLFYQKYAFSKGNLSLRFEQIDNSNNQGEQLSKYCQEQQILLVAQTD